MPTKQVTYRNDKAVVVSVYVEKPREKRPSSIQLHNHHYHVHHTDRKEVIPGSASKGYDRRSGLLKYSHFLRESAKGASSTPLLTKCSTNNFQPPIQMVPLRKPKNAERPASLGNWKLLIPSFLRSWLNAQKMEKKKKRMRGGFLGNGLKKLQVPNVFSTICKCA
ncbi:hypothetical protein SESBI_18416 [Sesbania bispinosa]|nr:hypothetical protein SESBI_18416 [Sesbania bispinosa]